MILMKGPYDVGVFAGMIHDENRSSYLAKTPIETVYKGESVHKGPAKSNKRRKLAEGDVHLDSG